MVLSGVGGIFRYIALIMVFCKLKGATHIEYRLYYSYFPTQKRENILSITSSLAVLPLSS